MPQATKRPTPAKPAPKPAQHAQPKPAGSKAAQAAQHQGRPAPAAPKPSPAQTRPASNKPSTAVAKVDERDAQLPAYMRGMDGYGKENIGREDIETPRLKLIQGLSKELEAYDGLKPGHFFHTAAEHIFDESFRAVPIFMDRRYLLWRPLETGGGIIARADDGVHWSPDHGDFEVTLAKKDGGNKVTYTLAKTVKESGLANWGTMNPDDPNSPPAATLMYTFVLAFPDNPELMPAALTFQRSSIKMGRKLNTKLKTVRGPLFGSVFNFEAMKDKNGAGQEFYNINTIGAGLLEDEDLFKQYKAMHDQLRDKGLQIKDIEGLQGEEDEAGDGDDAPGGKEY